MKNGRYAAIDIGTVTCRMLVADVRDSEVYPLDKEYRITNLGESVDAARKLQPKAMERVASAIDDFLKVRDAFNTQEHPLINTMVCATSAARDAENADEFEALLAKRNLILQIISGEQEAAFTFTGATIDFPNETVMVVDVGGGSTELSIGVAGEGIRRAHSFDIGSRRVTERFFQNDPPHAAEIEQARNWMREQFAKWMQSDLGQPAHIDRMIAVAGTATSVVSIREKMGVYDSDRVHGSCVSFFELQSIERGLASQTLAERERVIGLDPGRAPVIVAGLLILEEAMRAANVAEFTVSETDILQGMILYSARMKSLGDHS